MFHWSFTSLVQFWPPLIFNFGHAYAGYPLALSVEELGHYACRSYEDAGLIAR